MTSGPTTITGYVVTLPRKSDPHQASVAIVQDNTEYRVLPRGAGIDLVDEVNVSVEATGLVSQEEENFYIAVRGYKVLEDDAWLDD